MISLGAETGDAASGDNPNMERETDKGQIHWEKTRLNKPLPPHRLNSRGEKHPTTRFEEQSRGSKTMKKSLLGILIILFVAPMLGGCCPYWYGSGYYGNRGYYGDGYGPGYYGQRYYGPYYTYPEYRGYR